MWNSLELKNIAWIYSCIITDISLMYTALDFYLWRGSIWVFILTIMDKTSSLAPQDNRSSREQSVSVGIIGDKTKLKTPISDDWSASFECWLLVVGWRDLRRRSWPVFCSVFWAAWRNIQEPPVTEGQRDRQIVERWIRWRDDWRTMQDMAGAGGAGLVTDCHHLLLVILRHFDSAKHPATAF